MGFANHIPALFTLVIGYSSLLTRAWTLQDNYNANTWSQGMRAETRTTNAEYVNYLSKDAALSSGLIRTTNNQLYVGVDSSSVLDPNSGIGRKSVRLRTNKAYNAGTLVIGDFAHIPSNVCGVWPSFWMVGPSWPQDGEIDILEGVNQMTQNQITIHSRPGCTPSVGPQGQTGSQTGFADCGGNGGDIGCGVFNNKAEGWGSGFNAAGGGIYAMAWTSTSIQVWQWKQSDVPANARSDNPDPAAWGPPVANWVGCDFAGYFDNMNIILNTAFCGNWAGAVWKAGSCAPLATECYQYVAANPQVYSETYWLVNSIKVFSQ